MGDTTALPPNPGSTAAVALGCTCPVIDNAHGRGYMGGSGTFVFTRGCPVHDTVITPSSGDVFVDLGLEGRAALAEHRRGK